jgi:RNA polymerase sigma-70 factor (ECF subfamily)
VREFTEERHARVFADSGDQRHLVARLRVGDVDAVQELYLEYRKPIYGFLFRLARDRNVADDLFQNTWLKVSGAVRRLRDDTELKAWLFTVARNEYRSYRRWQLVDVSRVFLFYRDREQPVLEAPHPNDESGALTAIERGLGLLAPSDREVLLLVCVEGMAPPQAAAVLGISHAALRQRLGRARARLKSTLSRLESEWGTDEEALGRKR